MRAQLLELLKNWHESRVSEEEIHRFAEDALAQLNSDEEEKGRDEIAMEVLVHLDIMNHQLITRDDIPAIVDFLETSANEEVEGWEKWRGYWTNIDFESRKIELKGSDFYVV